MSVACLFLFLTIFAVGSQGAYIANGRIVGGTPVEIEEAPYHVLVKVPVTPTSFIVCGGSIIARNVILTAAHCVEGAKKIKVRVGTKYFNKGGTEYESSNHKVHEGYDSGTKNDIALVWLSEKLEYSKTVARIELPLSTDVIEDGTMNTITGWGSTKEGGKVSNILLKAEVPIVNQEVCTKTYVPLDLPVNDGMICAGFMGEGGKDSCQGDSGGPMVANGKQWGVVSWGHGCARPNYPGVYARVTYFREWINKYVEFD